MKRIILILSCAVALLAVSAIPLVAQDLWPDYTGNARCRSCHQFAVGTAKAIDMAEFDKSGHPWKIQRIDRSKVDAQGIYKPFPTGTNVDGIPLAPEARTAGFSYTAADTSIAYMIGGFGWKARWMSKNGWIYEGTKAQYNIGMHHPTLKNHGPYNAANVVNRTFSLRDTVAQTGLSYTCGSCHTTGWKPYDAATQPVRYDNRPDFAGTFSEFGVQCEGCHGPGRAHADLPSKANILTHRYDGEFGCIKCHARGLGTRIPVKSGNKFLDHREQYDQMQFTKHRRSARMTCVTCHDPHRSTMYDRGGLKTEGTKCEPCHTSKAVSITKVVGGVSTPTPHSCQDCHMPFIGSTAIEQNDNRADQASHMWKINTAAVGKIPTMWTSATGTLNVVIPSDSIVAHTLDFACLGCHTTKSLTWASGYAKGIHTKSPIVVNVEGAAAQIPSAFYLAQNYPNPFNPSTMISFGLPQASDVYLAVYNVVGQEIKVLTQGRYAAGSHTVTWDGRDATGESVASGVYLYKLVTDNWMQTKKMMLMQ